MKHTRPLRLILSCLTLLGLVTLLPAADLNILIIGSTRSYSDGGESGVVREKAFNPTVIATQLQSILAQDSAITDPVNVQFENIFKTKALTVDYSGSNVYDFTSHCYSLAQHYMWPEGKTTRLANLRGEDGTAWDYVIIMADPYIMANFPGMYAEGVKLLVEEINQGTAEPLLFAQWPENSSTFTSLDFNEVVYRVGNSADVKIIPGGKAWSTLPNQDASSNHPTSKGAYLAASSIYSGLYTKSAKTSSFVYTNPTLTNSISDHALTTVQANQNTNQYTGAFAENTVFSMKYVTKRTINFRETGTSTEDRLRQALGRVDDRCRVTLTTSGTFWDFNYGRGNDWWEDNKDYEVDPAKYDRSYGFPMHHYKVASAFNTMPYGIDKHYYFGSSYEDGTDLGIAYNMIRPGTRELGLPLDVRAIPIRLLWLKMREQSPDFNPLGDNTHMSSNLNDASAAFMYTLLSGRCPIINEPSPQGSSAWKQWLGHKVGYETAWQMSHLTTRAPGFKVLPSATNAKTVTPTTTETMTVHFALPPQNDVIVNIYSSNANAVIAGPQKLVFTPQNYNTPQNITVMGLPGGVSSEDFNVMINTVSDDEIYDDLSDSWSYTNNRSSTQGLTEANKGTTLYDVFKDSPRTINLNTSGANFENTKFAGPNKGTLSWEGTNVVYTPESEFSGKDGFGFTVNHNGVLSQGHIEIDVLDSTLPSIYGTWLEGSFAHSFTQVGTKNSPDGDDLNNFIEFAFGTDPTVNDNRPLLLDGSVNGIPTLATDDDGATFDFLFVRRDDHGTSGGVTYTPQFSSDLVTFYDIATAPVFVADSSDDNYEIVKVRYPTALPNGEKALFGRVQVNQEP